MSGRINTPDLPRCTLTEPAAHILLQNEGMYIAASKQTRAVSVRHRCRMEPWNGWTASWRTARLGRRSCNATEVLEKELSIGA